MAESSRSRRGRYTFVPMARQTDEIDAEFEENPLGVRFAPVDPFNGPELPDALDGRENAFWTIGLVVDDDE